MKYQRHLETAHHAWEKYRNAAIFIDATCGNGHDTLILAKFEPNALYAIDINPEAIKKTQERLKEYSNIQYFCQSHAQFPEEIEPGTVDLIVYNLGYLPGGDKCDTTEAQSTLMSLYSAVNLIRKGGLISVTCYPGHPEGEREEKAILDWAKRLDKNNWNVVYTQWLNKEKSPTLLLFEKIP